MKIISTLYLFLPFFFLVLNQAAYFKMVSKLEDLFLPAPDPKVGWQNLSNVKTYINAKKGKLLTDWWVFQYFGSLIAFFVSMVFSRPLI